MTTITVSSKYQIVIPRKAREHMKISPGTRLQVKQDDQGIHLVKEPTLEEIRGLLQGMEVIDSDIRDERDRELP